MNSRDGKYFNLGTNFVLITFLVGTYIDIELTSKFILILIVLINIQYYVPDLIIKLKNRFKKKGTKKNDKS